ncbi:hypothetical protein MMC13_001444 [Lambiella insularis]|nr:hypothetical protein [Lambiella insularis]
MNAYLPNHATISFFHHPRPIDLHLKQHCTSSSSCSPSPSPTSLLTLCSASTPACILNPLLFNGHLQTFWTAAKATDIPIHYKRHVFSAADPAFAGTFAVDFVVHPYADSDATLPPRTTYYSKKEYEDLGSHDKKPMVIVLHGLTGGSHEVYLRTVLEPLVEAGWEACVVTARGCAMSAITTGVLYNARATWDVRQVVRWARERWPERELFGMGFSMGANILVNVCEHWGLAGSRDVFHAWLPIHRSNHFNTHTDDVSDKCRVVVVPGRGGDRLPAQGGGGMFESVESGGGELGIAENMVGKGSVFKNHGRVSKESI